MKQLKENSAKIYNDIRRILFSTYHKYGIDKTLEYLEGYKVKLESPSYIGLKAEINFYKKKCKEFDLVVAADVGDHTDFSGRLGSQSYRFDVTTNADYKKLKDYEPLQKTIDAKYKIAVVKTNGDLDELIDINFPFCPICQNGRLMDIVVLLPENHNSHGESQFTNDQALISACSNCNHYEEKKRISTSFLNDYQTEIQNEYDNERDRLDYLESIGESNEFNIQEVILNHSMNILPYLHKQFDKTLVGLGEKQYQITDPRDGDGFLFTKLRWKSNIKIIRDYLKDDYNFYL